MKITFYTNAMLLLESKNSRVLMDPWVTFDDVSSSGFYNFPRCTLTREEIAAIKPDFIYITHTHPDHFDKETLSLFSKDTSIIVSYYEQNFTERNIRQLGFTDVRVSDPEEGIALNGEDHCWIEPAANSPQVDSLGVFRMNGYTAVNINDNTFNEAQCQSVVERYGPIDIALLPSAAHGPWPMFFDNFSPEEKQKLGEERSLKQKESFYNYVKSLSPKWVVPVAGGIICAGDKVNQYYASGIRPRSEVVAYAQEKLDFQPVFLSQSNMFNFESQVREGEYVESTYETEADYLGLLKTKKSKFSSEGSFYVSPKERIDLTRLLKLARKVQQSWQERLGLNSKMAYYFDVGEEELYRLTLEDDSVVRVNRKNIQDELYEIFTLPYELLLGMLTRHYVWSNVNTQHMSFYRHASKPDNAVMLLINYLQI